MNINSIFLQSNHFFSEIQEVGFFCIFAKLKLKIAYEIRCEKAQKKTYKILVRET